MLCEKTWIDFLQAMMTPTIAAVAVWIAHRQRVISSEQKEIAFQQKELNRIKLNAELYERRIKIYAAVQQIVATIVSQRKLQSVDAWDFGQEIREADFLFGDEVFDYLNELRGHVIEFAVACEGYNDAIDRNSGLDPKEYVAKRDAEYGWFLNQRDPVKELFKPYLQLK